MTDIKNFFLVLSSYGLNSGLGFLTSIWIARLLGAEAFGALSVFIAFMAVFIEFAGKGMDWATVRFTARYLDEDPARGAVYFRVMFVTRMILGVLVLLLGNLGADGVARLLFQKPEYVTLIHYATVAAVGASFCSFILSYFQSTQQFVRYGIVNFLGNGFKAIPVLVCILAGVLTLNAVLWVYSLMGFGAAVVGLRWLPPHTLRAQTTQRRAACELWGFGKWMMLAALLCAIYARIDTLMLGALRDTRSVGVYAAAVNIVFAMDLLILSLFTILMPKVSRLKTTEEFKAYILHALKISAAIAIPLSSVYWLSDTLITFFYSGVYAEAIGVFRILFVGFMFSLMVQPMSLLFLARDKPELFSGIYLVLIAALIALHRWLIPQMGIKGAAYATSAGRILQAILILGLVGWLLTDRRTTVLVGNALTPTPSHGNH